MDNKKILSFNCLQEKVRELQQEGKVVVQSHGVFDLIHPGITTHLQRAKEQGDVLIVTVIRDRDVRRGPGRPVFQEEQRVENVTTLELVDYACIVDDNLPFEAIKKLNPDIFARGQSIKEREQHIHEEIFEEEKELYLGKCKIYETGGFSFNSTQIINNFLDIYPEEVKSFLQDFSQRYSFPDIVNALERLKDLRVLVLGDGIIDEYHYCQPMGRASKAPLVVHNYLYHEIFAGGVFAVANHLAGLCEHIQLVSILGKEDTREDFIRTNLKANIQATFFYREDGPTVIKKRYINEYYNQKLFEVNYLNNTYIDEALEEHILGELRSIIPQYDLILISDFGHGFITKAMIETIQTLAKKIAVNTQNNAANSGYNMITKYQNPFYVCLDESELRLAEQERFLPILDLVRDSSQKLNAENLIVTLGKKGSFGINQAQECCATPIFSSKVLDTVGAGDAFFAYTAPCFACGVPLELVSFLGNAVGALAVQIMGNKRAVEKYELLEFIQAILR